MCQLLLRQVGQMTCLVLNLKKKKMNLNCGILIPGKSRQQMMSRCFSVLDGYQLTCSAPNIPRTLSPDELSVWRQTREKEESGWGGGEEKHRGGELQLKRQRCAEKPGEGGGEGHTPTDSRLVRLVRLPLNCPVSFLENILHSF